MRLLCLLVAIAGVVLRTFGDLKGMTEASVLGMIVVLAGLAVYCRLKGRNVAWSLFSLIPFVGPLVVVLLPEKRKDEDDESLPVLRLVPDYVQLHLASRAPGHALARRTDGSWDTDDVPPLVLADARMVASISEEIAKRLPRDDARLVVIEPRRIVETLGGIYTEHTGRDMYAEVCRRWCVAKRLIPEQ
jgi:hypothetical protein